ncbi:hypothetical protein ACFT1A_29460 [Rhodococcus sp. NPDC057135]|uniref:hypothetical protein n=1 Tax=Rhodococcus sp. NPDC057135 TaxID=3346028 RepID=UPI003640D440
MTFTDAETDGEAAIDAAYEAKYGHCEESFAVPIMQGEDPQVCVSLNLPQVSSSESRVHFQCPRGPLTMIGSRSHCLD